jgi:hypothetical protein
MKLGYENHGADEILEHEQHFLDTPRLSTLQALLLLLKARESAPKRGYYYRSWMTCRTIVFMAKDLEINEHYESHAGGKTCGSDPVECLTKTRIWQTILVCEMMVGAPQGMRSPETLCNDATDSLQAGLTLEWILIPWTSAQTRLILI